jgi:hypothetical protein
LEFANDSHGSRAHRRHRDNKAADVGLLAVAIGVVLVIAGKPTGAPGNVCDPEVVGYAAAITTVGIMTTPTIMIQ